VDRFTPSASQKKTLRRFRNKVVGNHGARNVAVDTETGEDDFWRLFDVGKEAGARLQVSACANQLRAITCLGPTRHNRALPFGS
jgi:hypothetical protein